MLDLNVSLASNGAARISGYEQLLRMGYARMPVSTASLWTLPESGQGLPSVQSGTFQNRQSR